MSEEDFPGVTLEEAKQCVPPGWVKLIEDLYAQMPSKCLVHQVKSKFGGLRFYVSRSTKEFDKLIDAAEYKSLKICNICGEPGMFDPEASVKFHCRCNEHKDTKAE